LKAQGRFREGEGSKSIAGTVVFDFAHSALGFFLAIRVGMKIDRHHDHQKVTGHKQGSKNHQLSFKETKLLCPVIQYIASAKKQSIPLNQHDKLTARYRLTHLARLIFFVSCMRNNCQIFIRLQKK
jgi:hypothetical protein